VLRRDAESQWRPAQMLLLTFGPVVFDWLLKPNSTETASAETLRTRCQSGLRLLMHDLSVPASVFSADNRGMRGAA
jgi:hypothetical protein